jgi:hypothetical protein
MSVLTKELEPYKLRARRHRGGMLKALASGDRKAADTEFEDAQSAIAEGFAVLDKYERPDPTAPGVAGEGETAVAEQLADLWGIQGGLYRSRGGSSNDPSIDLDHAIGAYDNGWQYESSRRFRILNSYNTVNRLVLRILRTPSLLGSKAPVPGLGKSMGDLLGDAVALIERQMDTGRQDIPWALADLAMTELLRDGSDVASILDQLDESTLTDPYPLQSMLNVIRDLLRAGVQPRERLITAGEHIRLRLPEAMKGNPLDG